MARIEDYALIGNCRSAALVSRSATIEWLCLPDFDSAACFASLLGGPENGFWSIAPRGSVERCHRAYAEQTLVLETTFETDDGAVVVTDFMDPECAKPRLVRIVSGIEGAVDMALDLSLRFRYGQTRPWLQANGNSVTAIAGANLVLLESEVCLRAGDRGILASFTVCKGQSVAFDFIWAPSYERPEKPCEARTALERTLSFWRNWIARSDYEGPWREAVERSLITLKALTSAKTGGIVAAPTMSLPEEIGGARNWDYRYCWLRDATLTLYAFLEAGFVEEAKAWREWLLRAVAGDPDKMQILYSIRGEALLAGEYHADWLAGYEGSRPVLIGNLARLQRQLDVFGEIMDAFHYARRNGVESDDKGWCIQRDLLAYLAKTWTSPDKGIWEVRGPDRQFTHSKLMCWVAFDRAVKAVRRQGLEGPADHWATIRDAIHRDICEKGFNSDLNAFVQLYGGDRADSSILLMPLVGFLPISDERIKSTIAFIEQKLMVDGFLRRYEPSEAIEGLKGSEGAFLACSFFLVDCYIRQGRRDDALALFERLLSIRNDVGLLSEEYDPAAKRLLGNFPQAFSHVGLINSAMSLSGYNGPAHDRHH